MRTSKSKTSSLNNNDMLFRSIPIPTWIYNFKNLQFIDVNDAAIENYGYTKNEFIKLKLPDIVLKESKIISNNKKELLSKQNQLRYETHKKKDNSILSVEVVSNEIIFNGEKGIIEYLIDVTEKENEQITLNQLIESSPVSFILINKYGKINLVNKRTEELFGYKREELLGRLISILIPENYKNIHDKYEISFFKNPHVRDIKSQRGLHGLHKNGTEIPIEIGLNPIKTKNDISVLASIIDITERKNASEKLSKTENQFRTTLENMSEGFQIVGNDFTYLYLNKAAEIQAKKSKEELLGNKMMKVYPGIEKTNMFLKLKECLKNKIQHSMENEFVYSDGQKARFLLNMEPVPEGILILSKDITQEKLNEEELKNYQKNLEKLVKEKTEQLEKKIKELKTASKSVKENEENLSLIFENINDYGIFLLDINGNILNWSPSVEKLTRYNKNDIVNKNFSILFSEEDKLKKIPEKELKRALEEGKVEAEGWRVKKDGSRFWTYSVLNILKDTSGNVRGFIKIIKDMTERMVASEQLKAHSLQLEELNNELESFSYSVSHDLRAPLRHIDGFLKLVQQDDKNLLTEESKTYFKYITDSVSKMGNLIEDLLSFSRMGRSEMYIVNIDLAKLVEEVINEFYLETENREIKWEINDLPKVSADRAMIKQVFINLISNAIKFTKDKEEAIINIGSFPKGNYFTIFVKDNGAGFDMDYVNKLFGVFQRLHSSSEFEGTGIGLANVKRIIARHEGRVWAEGALNKGATIYFTLKKEDK